MTTVPDSRKPPAPGSASAVEDVLINALRESLKDLAPEAAKQHLDELQTGIRRLRFELLEGELQSAIASAQPSPAVAAGLAVSQRALDRLNDDEEFRLLSAGEIAERAHRGRNWPAQNARAGSLIRVDHAGKVFYPAFQLDPESRTVRPWVPKMIEILHDLDLDGRSFAIWAATPSPVFGGDRPAEHMGDAEFLSTAAVDLADV